MVRHAYAEARKEVASWFTGEPYQWTPFRFRSDPMEGVEPMNAMKIVR